jgi:hypothetical protein
VQDPETPLRMEWRFVRLEYFSNSNAAFFPFPSSPEPAIHACQPERYAVVSKLPIKRLMRATPKRAEQARRLARKFRWPVHSLLAASGRSSRRKGIVRGQFWPSRIDPDNRIELMQGSCAQAGKAPGNHGRLREERGSAAVYPRSYCDGPPAVVVRIPRPYLDRRQAREVQHPAGFG